MIKCTDAVEIASYSGITAYRSGRVVMLVIAASATGSEAGWKTIGTVDAKFRPAGARSFVGFNNNDSSFSASRPLMMEVAANGAVRVYLFSDKLSVTPRATVTYIVE